MKDRFCVYKSTLRCAECGGTIILEGPARELSCPHCESSYSLSPQFWKGLLEDALEDYYQARPGGSGTLLMGGHQLQRAWGRELPFCDGCKTTLPVESISEDQSAPFLCSCGVSMSVWPAPAWLREEMPEARQIFGAPPEDGPDAEPVTAPPATLKPIWFACPRCAASLEIRVETPRILTCGYCEADLFMPDDLWRRLHPVRKRVPWWIRYTPPRGASEQPQAGFGSSPERNRVRRRRRR